MSTPQPHFKLKDSGPVTGRTAKHLVSPGKDGIRQLARKTHFEDELQPEHVEGFGPNLPTDILAMIAEINATSHEAIAVTFDHRGAHLEANLEEFKKKIEALQGKHKRYKTPLRWVPVKNPVQYETTSLPSFYSDPIRTFMARREQEKQEVVGLLLESAAKIKTLFELVTRGPAERGLMVVACVIHLIQGVIHFHHFYVTVDEHGCRLGHQSPKLEVGGNHTVFYKIGLSSIAARRYRSLGVAPIPQLLRTPNGKSRLVTGWDLLEGKLDRAREKGRQLWDVVVNDGVDSLIEDFASRRPDLAKAIGDAKSAAVARHNQRAQERRVQLSIDAREKLIALEAEHNSLLKREIHHLTEVERLKKENLTAVQEKEAAEVKLKAETEMRKRAESMLGRAQSLGKRLLKIVQILAAGTTIENFKKFGAYVHANLGLKNLTDAEATIAAIEVVAEFDGQNKKSEISDKKLKL